MAGSQWHKLDSIRAGLLMHIGARNTMSRLRVSVVQTSHSFVPRSLACLVLEVEEEMQLNI